MAQGAILVRANAVDSVQDAAEWGGAATDKILFGGFAGVGSTRRVVAGNGNPTFTLTQAGYDEWLSKLPQIARGDFVIIEG